MEGTVTRVVPFGAFVALDHGIEGIIPNAELADHRVRKPEDVVSSEPESAREDHQYPPHRTAHDVESPPGGRDARRRRYLTRIMLRALRVAG